MKVEQQLTEVPFNIVLPGEKVANIQQQSHSYNLSKFRFDAVNQTVYSKQAGIQIDNFNAKTSQTTHDICSYPCHYYPKKDDFVIGIIKNKNNEFYTLDIRSVNEAYLNVFDFEGATKKSKPNYDIGQLIYCRISEDNKFLKTKVSCINPKSKKEWVTGESFFGDLKGGVTIEADLSYCQKLVQEKMGVFQILRDYTSFEVAVGVNGIIWIKTDKIKNTILIMNIIMKCQSLDLEETKQFITSVASLFSQK